MDEIEENTSFHQKLTLFQNSMMNDTKLETMNQRVDETIVSEGDQLPNISTIQQAEYQKNINHDAQIDKKKFERPPINILYSGIQNKSNYYTVNIDSVQKNQYDGSFSNKSQDRCQSKMQSPGNKFAMLQAEYKINSENQSQQLQNGLPLLQKLKRDLETSESKINKNLRVSNKKIKNFINDYSDNFLEDDKLFQQCCTSIYSCFSFIKFQNKIKLPLFHPQSYFKIGLDLFFCLINCLFFFFSSIFIIFSVDLEAEQDLYNFMYITWFFYLTIKLNTAIYEKSNLIQNRKAIALKFVKKYALYDIIPFILMVIPYSYHKLRFTFKILQFLQLKNVYSKLCEVYLSVCILYQNYYMIQIIKLMAKLFLIAHIIACLWYLIGVLEVEYFGEEKTWFDDGITVDRNWAKLYVCSLYWSLSLMTTGSNSAQTIAQTSFTSFTMLIATIVFGYLVNIIGIILTEADQEEEKQRRDINQINKYMRKRQISKNLQRAINLDLEYYYQHNYKKDNELNQQVLSKISSNLLHDLKQQYFGKILEKIPFLANNFSQNSLKKIAMIIEEESYLPGQVINDISSWLQNKLIYIVEGQVKQLKQVSEFDLEHLNCNNNVGRDQVLGEVQFFSGANDGKIYQACDFTQILTISRDRFLEVIKQNEKDLQIFCSIREKVGLYQDYEVIQLACKVCFKNNHQYDHCPLVHFDKNEFTIKENFFLKQKQIRQDWERKKKASLNARMNLAIIGEKQKEINNISKNLLLTWNNKRDKFFALSTIQSKDLDQFYRCNSEMQRSFTPSKFEDLEEEPKNQNAEYPIQRQRQSSMQKYKNQTKSTLSITQNIEDELSKDHPIKEKKFFDQTSNLDILNQYTQNLSVQQNAIKETPNINLIQNQQMYLPILWEQRIDKIEDLLKGLTKEAIRLNYSNEKAFPNENNQNNKSSMYINLELDLKKDYDIYFPQGNSKKIFLEYNQKIRTILKKRLTYKARHK